MSSILHALHMDVPTDQLSREEYSIILCHFCPWNAVQQSHTLECRASSPCLAVSSLVSAVDQLHKIGDNERKQEAQEILNKSLAFAHAIEEQLAMLGTSEQLPACQKQVNACQQAAPACTAHENGQVQNIAARASIDTIGEAAAMECPSDVKSTKLWTFEGSELVQQQLPSHRQLLKVSVCISSLFRCCCSTYFCMGRSSFLGGTSSSFMMGEHRELKLHCCSKAWSYAGVRGGCQDESEVDHCRAGEGGGTAPGATAAQRPGSTGKHSEAQEISNKRFQVFVRV